MPLVYAHEILSQCDIYFLNGGHFSKFLYLALLSTWLNLEPSYLAQLCTYTGATHREEIIHLSIIFLKLWIFKKFTFYTFWLIGKHAKDTKLISGIPHTDTCTYTDTGTHRQILFLHFTNLIFGTRHTHKYTQTHAHTETQIPFLAHLVMSLCNHDLSIMCHWHHHQCHCCHWCCLCTALPQTVLIIETLYLSNIFIYMPSICTWNIKSMWCIFFKWQLFE